MYDHMYYDIKIIKNKKDRKEINYDLSDNFNSSNTKASLYRSPFGMKIDKNIQDKNFFTISELQRRSPSINMEIIDRNIFSEQPLDIIRSFGIRTSFLSKEKHVRFGIEDIWSMLYGRHWDPLIIATVLKEDQLRNYIDLTLDNDLKTISMNMNKVLNQSNLLSRYKVVRSSEIFLVDNPFDNTVLRSYLPYVTIGWFSNSFMDGFELMNFFADLFNKYLYSKGRFLNNLSFSIFPGVEIQTFDHEIDISDSKNLLKDIKYLKINFDIALLTKLYDFNEINLIKQERKNGLTNFIQKHYLKKYLNIVQESQNKLNDGFYNSFLNELFINFIEIFKYLIVSSYELKFLTMIYNLYTFLNQHNTNIFGIYDKNLNISFYTNTCSYKDIIKTNNRLNLEKTYYLISQINNLYSTVDDDTLLMNLNISEEIINRSTIKITGFTTESKTRVFNLDEYKILSNDLFNNQWVHDQIIKKDYSKRDYSNILYDIKETLKHKIDNTNFKFSSKKDYIGSIYFLNDSISNRSIRRATRVNTNEIFTYILECLILKDLGLSYEKKDSMWIMSYEQNENTKFIQNINSNLDLINNSNSRSLINSSDVRKIAKWFDIDNSFDNYGINRDIFSAFDNRESIDERKFELISADKIIKIKFTLINSEYSKNIENIIMDHSKQDYLGIDTSNLYIKDLSTNTKVSLVNDNLNYVDRTNWKGFESELIINPIEYLTLKFKYNFKFGTIILTEGISLFLTHYWRSWLSLIFKSETLIGIEIYARLFAKLILGLSELGIFYSLTDYDKIWAIIKDILHNPVNQVFVELEELINKPESINVFSHIWESINTPEIDIVRLIQNCFTSECILRIPINKLGRGIFFEFLTIAFMDIFVNIDESGANINIIKIVMNFRSVIAKSKNGICKPIIFQYSDLTRTDYNDRFVKFNGNFSFANIDHKENKENILKKIKAIKKNLATKLFNLLLLK